MDSYELVHTEDAVQALMDYLVEPVLPVKSSGRHPPSIALQEQVAKQMHAVVLLYNYYHRKQFPQLEFLDFASFCKVAVNAKPNLLAHMKFMQGGNADTANLDEHLSITEKAIMDACNICLWLDASKDVPSIEGWPITEVSVLLIDSAKKNCSLMFSSKTQGTWSLIEKEYDNTNPKSEGMLGGKSTNKHKTVTKGFDEASFQQVAFLAVKEITGINREDLAILGSCDVYSLSKKKTATRFYLMQCTKLVNEDVIKVPIKDAIDSLQGPLVKWSFGNCSITPSVEYFHLLPSAAFVSDWISREVFQDGSQPLQLGSQNLNTNTDAPSRKAIKISTKTLNHKENVEYCRSGSSDAFCRPNSVVEEDSSAVHTPSVEKSKSAAEVPFALMEKKSSSTDSDLNANGSSFLNKEGMVASPINQWENETKCIKDAAANGIWNTGSSSQNETPIGEHPPPVPSTLNFHNSDKVQVIMASKGDELLQTALKVLKKKREDLSHQLRILEEEIARCERNIQTISTSGEDDLLLKIESILEACNVACSSAAIHTYHWTHLCSEEQCRPRSIKRKKLSEATLSVQDPCQELDDICCKNNWILPRFNIFPSNGGFCANVTVQGMDFECSSGGDVSADPREARESAAAQALNKLRTMACNTK
ncbi:PREDICTED: uncharacterized protein LOC104605278 isoform X2 [Nelumbo nucifera]|uniref:Uncharacterized protein LOC104605278 isoform X2 n=2 Tax=Nelumbo nucifera TaxID=4432 RepID=A0A1U8AY37_NELNU|nr:PREDICTED: uncharacterized protein LOC104605278 isoform X2 [Nelumbo nucifera]DAD25316.1 TPA_asm: hypothetical protein HUJ06_026780 [Nelumbo nucifera]